MFEPEHKNRNTARCAPLTTSYGGLTSVVPSRAGNSQKNAEETLAAGWWTVPVRARAMEDDRRCIAGSPGTPDRRGDRRWRDERTLKGQRSRRPLERNIMVGQVAGNYSVRIRDRSPPSRGPHLGTQHLNLEEDLTMPTTKTVEKPQEIYQIKVTLLGTDPPIWRRLLVPADLTLEQLHDVVQVAMGWEDCHMHEFRIGQQRFGEPDPMEQVLGGPRTASERTARLFSVLARVGAKAVYTYDFGDDWEHQIVLEKRLAPEPGRAYPACLAGERHGPPEDCGGIGGFDNLLEAIADPQHEQHEELLDWVGEDFDPEAFSVEEINRRLASLQRRRRSK